MSFVWDNTALPANKSNVVAIPAAANPANYFQGTDFNALKVALEDCRTAMWKGGGVIAPRASAPVSGTYAVGDLCFNSAPSDGGNIGWVCTAAGTPGTWLEFGAVAADVLNGGGGVGGGGASDIASPERLYGVNTAELSLYRDGLAGGVKGRLGFLTAASANLEIKNEVVNGDIRFTVSGTGTIDFIGGDLLVDAAKSLMCSNFYPASGVAVQGSALGCNTEAVRIMGVDESRFELYPDGFGSGRKGFLGFNAGDNVLRLKNEEAVAGDMRLGCAAGKLYLGETSTVGVRGIYLTTIGGVNPSGVGAGSQSSHVVAVAGIEVGDHVLGVRHDGANSMQADVAWHGFCHANGFVTCVYENESAGTVDPGSGTMYVTWMDVT